MKSKILFIFLLCLVQISVNAQEKTIKTDIRKWRPIGRSLTAVPILSHESNTVYIYSDLPLENMEVTVTDASGCVAYAGVLCVGMGGTISFIFDDTGDGEYMIEVIHGRKYLCGWFEL